MLDEPRMGDTLPRLTKERRTRGKALAVAAASVATVGTWALPPGRLEPVRVETATTLGPNEAPRIALTFSTSEDLAATRTRLGLDNVAARLSACGDEALVRQVVVAGAGHSLPDGGPVRRLETGADGRFRYRAVFDGRLAEVTDHQTHFTPATTAPGGLCFSLHGARMWWGGARSAQIAVPKMGTPQHPDTDHEKSTLTIRGAGHGGERLVAGLGKGMGEINR